MSANAKTGGTPNRPVKPYDAHMPIQPETGQTTAGPEPTDAHMPAEPKPASDEFVSISGTATPYTDAHMPAPPTTVRAPGAVSEIVEPDGDAHMPAGPEKVTQAATGPEPTDAHMPAGPEKSGEEAVSGEDA